MKVLDLFSGIGGFSLGLERAGMETAAFCEIDPFCREVLKKHWPDVPIYEDVRKLKGGEIAADIICGGYPCQPFSLAGKRQGKEDDRHLWPEVARLLSEIRPRWFIGENVAGHISLGLDDVLSDLEGQGYDAQTFIIPACSVKAPHRRDRVWVVAHSGEVRHVRGNQLPEGLKHRGGGEAFDIFDTCVRWGPEPGVCRVVDGVPTRMDKDRIAALGNGLVPIIPEMLGRAIMEIEGLAQG